MKYEEESRERGMRITNVLNFLRRQRKDIDICQRNVAVIKSQVESELERNVLDEASDCADAMVHRATRKARSTANFLVVFIPLVSILIASIWQKEKVLFEFHLFTVSFF